MIVTKELAQKYLIRKHCYLIEPDKDDSYRLVSTSVHWKEGMEVFETQEECLEEINRRVKEKMDAGNCPRCHYKRLEETERTITHLELLQKIKAGALYRCTTCHTVWYKAAELPKAIAFDASLADYALEWAARDLAPTKEMETILHTIGDISNDASYQLFPAYVVLKSGFELPYALIKLERRPPPQNWFQKSGWFYLDQVAEIRPSPYAYASPIAKYIMTSPSDWVYIKDVSDGKVYSFSAQAGIFMPQEFAGKTFELLDAKNSKGKHNAIMVQEVHERGGPDYWSFTPPEKPSWFWGDRH